MNQVLIIRGRSIIGCTVERRLQLLMFEHSQQTDRVEHDQAVGSMQYTGGLERDLGLCGQPA